MLAIEAIKRMNDPRQWMMGNWFLCQIDFNDSFDPLEESEVSFKIDCSNENWRDELLKLWEDYRNEKKLPEDCVTEAWATLYEE